MQAIPVSGWLFYPRKISRKDAKETQRRKGTPLPENLFAPLRKLLPPLRLNSYREEERVCLVVKFLPQRRKRKDR